MREKYTRWLILGHYGGHNTGDEAMLYGLLAGMLPEVREQTVVISKDGTLPDAFQAFGVTTIPAKFGPLLRTVLSCDGVILGGGTHFQDDFTFKRYLRHLRYLSRYLLVFLFAMLTGKRRLMLSMGFGPFCRKPTIWLTKIGLWLCSFVTVREQASYDRIESWIAPAKMDRAFDLAALITSQCEQPQPHTQRAPVLGVSATSVKNTYAGGEEQDRLFWEEMSHALAEVLRTNQRLHIRIFVIRGGERESDVELSQKLFDFLKPVDALRVEIVPHSPDPLDTLKKIQECRWFIAARFHAALLSYLAECGLLFIAYHQKVTDLANEIGLQPEACLDMTRTVSRQSISQKIDMLIGDGNDFVAQMPISDAISRAQKNMDAIERFSTHGERN